MPTIAPEGVFEALGGEGDGMFGPGAAGVLLVLVTVLLADEVEGNPGPRPFPLDVDERG